MRKAKMVSEKHVSEQGWKKITGKAIQRAEEKWKKIQ